MPALPTLESIAGCRIGILGFGREGRSALKALRACNRELDVTILTESGPVEVDDAALRVGPFDERLAEFPVLLRSPGIPVSHPALERARSAGSLIVNPATLWLSERGAHLPVIGVTGSKGKSTTASLLAHLLRARGQRVILAGNIGVPLLDHLSTPADIAVVELSSYQLADLAGRLDIGIVTRLFPEHIDWHGSQAAYFASKLRIVELLEGRPLIVNASDDCLMRETAGVAGRLAGNRPPAPYRRGDVLIVGQECTVAPGSLALRGRHNLDNSALALQAAMLLGHPAEALVDALRDFCPLPHRLERIADQCGVSWVNDSIATSPYATLAALEAIADGPVVLIVGGKDRPADWSPVMDWIRHHGLSGLIGIPDNGPAVVECCRQQAGDRCARLARADSLESAVRLAAEWSRPGDTVVLSPGAPSFPRFRDFEHRGEVFRLAVAGLR
ncbi:MAG: UDP-N-acetylmuramoyl-L-alanine--D-glutamate ligase [Pseudomonadota bacterium]|nr:MAG: UDP-N-acetylmuramoyl-L-alanine--D-glutamate ligase [Pseudomonadota bacterium]